MGPFAANLPRSIHGIDLRFHLGKTSVSPRFFSVDSSCGERQDAVGFE